VSPNLLTLRAKQVSFLAVFEVSCDVLPGSRKLNCSAATGLTLPAGEETLLPEIVAGAALYRLMIGNGVVVHRLARLAST